MSNIRTITGDIAPDKIGITSMHDHTLTDLRNLNVYFKSMFGNMPSHMSEFKLENFSFLRTGMILLSDEHSVTDDVSYMTGEFNAFKKVGGQTICDASVIGMRGNLNDLKKISEQTGINVVCATGVFGKMQLSESVQKVVSKGQDAIMELLMNEVENGMDGTDIKPGFIKCGLYGVAGGAFSSEDMLNILMACAKLSAKTGMALEIHTESTLDKEEIVSAIDRILSETDIKPEKIIVLHTDQFFTKANILNEYVSELNATKQLSTELHEQLLKRGVNISIDTWGSPIENTQAYYPNDFDRMKVLIELIKKGYQNQIILGHDVVGKMYGVQYGNYGYTRIATFVPTMLKQVGYGEEVAQALLVNNPARILAY